MYKLTAKMEQNFRASLAKYHELFDGGRCQGRQHIYHICCIDVGILKGVYGDDWKQNGSHWYTVNDYGVTLSVHPLGELANMVEDSLACSQSR